MKEKTEKGTIQITYEKAPQKEKEVPLMAFLFDKNGTLVDKSAISGNSVSLNIRTEDRQSARLLIIPALDKKVESIDQISDLQRYKPYETTLKQNAEGKYSIMPIPGIYHPIWFGYWCRVRGSVVKNFTIGTTHGVKGLCRARVHICEIDRIWWWIDRIPDPIILKIPEIILYPIPKPINPGDPAPFERAQQFKNAEVFQAQSLELSAPKMQVEDLKHFSEHVKSKLFSGNAAAIRSAIKDNFQLFHPYFCYWRWLWPYFYYCEEVAVVYTDDFGNFDTNVFFHWGDQPDLYFWVEYLINGVWTTVYKPGIPCNTYWNYQCGTQITITVTDPRVQWACQNTIPGEVVWVKTVGSGVSVSHIKQVDEAGPTIQGVEFNRIGLTDTNMLYSMANNQGYIRPFGTSLYFVVQFGSGLPNPNVTYYRWSCQKVRNVDMSPATGASVKVLNNGISKSYTYEYVDFWGVTHFNVKSYPLGPNTVNGINDLFQIPPVNPWMAPVNASETNPQWDQNTVTVEFDTKQLDGDGLYEFWLELFDENGNFVVVPKTVFQVPDPNSFYPSINAPNNNLDIDIFDTTKAFDYKMLLRIDNSVATAAIYKVGILSGGGYVDSSPNCCGFVSYPAGEHADSDYLQLAFKAFHPQNFAWLSFDVQKGTCGSATSAWGLVEDNVDGYLRDTLGIYRDQFSPDELLGSCAGEGKAAFAETLVVETLTTDGNYLAFGDASSVAAFALEPV